MSSNPTNAVQWFEIPVADMEGATKFYQDVLDINMRLTPSTRL